MIKAVIFDMDGVLIDTELAYSKKLPCFFEEYGFPYEQHYLDRLIGSSREEGNRVISEMMKGSIEPDALWAKWHAYLKQHPIDYKKLRVDGAIEVMQQLKKAGYKIGLSSATEKEFILSHMQDCDLLEYFDAISSGHEVENSKPFPDVYLKTMKDLGVEPHECIVVEDSFYGIKAAKAAKAHRVYARQVTQLKVDQSEADELICDLREIIAKLER